MPQADGHTETPVTQIWPAGQFASVAHTVAAGAEVTHAGVQACPHSGRQLPLPQLPHVEPTAVHAGKVVVVVLVVVLVPLVAVVLVAMTGVQPTSVAQLPQARQHFS